MLVVLLISFTTAAFSFFRCEAMLQLNTLLSGFAVQDASTEQLVLGITVKVPTSRPAAGKCNAH